MQPQEVGDFFAEIKKALDSNWSDEALKSLSKHTVPEVIPGNHGWLLRGDLSTVWARWFIESLVDLAPYELDTELNIGHLHRPILSFFNATSPQVPLDERTKYAKVLTKFAWQMILARRARKRLEIGISLREDLWALGQPQPRCYLCGFLFGPQARDKFLRESKAGPPVSKLVDFTRPRGQLPAQLCIEVDHVIPVAEGGQTIIDNLRLACGWCNSTKNRYTNIYDATPWSGGIFQHPALGPVTRPQPLWVLRTVATRRRCEHPDGCSSRIEDSELFAGPRNPKGALTPVNLAVYCETHDPWHLDRWIGPKRLAASSTA
ncbi:HNH endonuclease signature motif containing protein [Streptomyces sp. NPDC088260]|uniref:HNH endonuclease signature motif containing protein n=1 Tax=Streptomyces sp. NPDC088260 TaxID=3365850 RepID=UPI00382E347E